MPVLTNGSERLDFSKGSPAVWALLILLFLASVKIPSAINSDIQPWDEGMYAARVNSISINGDFFDQSLHSVGKFYSGSHPPLLIWIGYVSSVIFGFSPVTLKMLILCISLLTVMMIYIIGKNFVDNNTGVYAAMIFSGNILFNVFSKRFQLDMPYVLLMLISFFFVLKLSTDKSIKFAVYAGIFFGLCLMSKILVGLFIPLVLFVTLVALRSRARFGMKDLLVITVIGLIISLPWHLYMLFKHGTEFTDYFFGFHLIDRALTGVELNQKSSGPLYHFNYFLSIIPFGILLFFAFVNNIRKFKELSFPILLLWIWTICGFVIITLFKTKLESYLLLVMPAAALLTASYLKELNKESAIVKTLILTALVLNIFWFATENFRPQIKDLVGGFGVGIATAISLLGVLLLFLLSRIAQRKINLKITFGMLIILTFIISNVFYLVEKPLWEDRFRIKEAVKTINESGAGRIFYVGTNYRYNPQFSYYLNGIDLGWKEPKYDYDFIDTNAGTEKVKARLELEDRNSIVVVEKDKINRAEYPASELFIPSGFRMIHKDTGYELYRRGND
ncbi:MAG: glycosyltransferase family 39 protein [Ignavibacteria bacterium]|nr:glycosyltransferase family 39 protein [Ignavibacteria bacterium]